MKENKNLFYANNSAIGKTHGSKKNHQPLLKLFQLFTKTFIGRSKFILNMITRNETVLIKASHKNVASKFLKCQSDKTATIQKNKAFI